MIDYYKILNLGLQKSKGNVTNELVEKNYLIIKENYLKMMEKGKIKNHNKNVEENKKSNSELLDAYLSGEYLKVLEDAYNALKTEESRSHYDVILKQMKEQEEKQKQSVHTKTIKQEQQKPINQMQQKTTTQVQYEPMKRIQNNQVQEQIEQQKPKKELDIIPINRTPKNVRQNRQRQQVGQLRQTQKISQIQQLRREQQLRQLQEERQQQLRQVQSQQVKQMKQEKSSNVNSIQGILGMINKEKTNTSELIAKIKKEAERKHPIKKPEEIESDDIEK